MNNIKIICQECNKPIVDAIYFGEGSYWHKECTDIDLALVFTLDKIKFNVSQKLVKVRIAVAIDVHGDWSAAGWGRAGEEGDMIDAAEGSIPGNTIYWVTAELEIPEEKKPKEVKASKIEKVSN